MRTLFVSNDQFDAHSSRKLLSDWLYNKYDLKMDLFYPGTKKIELNSRECFVSKKRGISLDNIRYLNQIQKQNKYDCIVYRGIENILISFFVSKTNNQKSIFLLTGLGKLFLIKQKSLRYFTKSLYIRVLKYFLKDERSILIVQNEEDKIELGLNKTIVINGSGFDYENPITKDYRRKKIVTATRMTKSKGVDDIINLCEEIIKSNFDGEYHIFGDYSHLSETYQNTINRLNQNENIHFYGFSDPSQLIESAHFAFFPTNYREGVPRFLIESIAKGLVVFTNPMPGCLGIISNQNGYSIQSVSTALNQMKHLDCTEFTEMSKRSHQLFKTKYCSDVVYEKFHEIIIS